MGLGSFGMPGAHQKAGIGGRIRLPGPNRLRGGTCGPPVPRFQVDTAVQAKSCKLLIINKKCRVTERWPGGKYSRVSQIPRGPWTHTTSSSGLSPDSGAGCEWGSRSGNRRRSLDRRVEVVAWLWRAVRHPRRHPLPDRLTHPGHGKQVQGLLNGAPIILR